MGMDLLKCEYILKYKDENVIRFVPALQKLTIVNRELLPFCIQNDPDSYEMIQKFCANRTLMFNRKNCKELLVACGIDDQTPINISIVTNALSFTDNYWICLASHNILWKEINLHRNDFSLDIPQISLTGDLKTIVEKVYTGELSVKGIRAKGIQNTAHYFVTASTFATAKENIRQSMTTSIYNTLLLAKNDFQNRSFIDFFQNYKSEKHYYEMMTRLESLTGK